MQEKHLLLPSAKSAVLVHSHNSWTRYVRLGAIGAGLLCVLVGAADVSSRLADRVLGPDAAFLAFGPAAAIGTPATATSTPGVVVPSRMRIPALGVDASVVKVGIKDDGTMGTPKNFADIGWYSLGAKPGEQGSAVFAGHVNNALSLAGVFVNLSKIHSGDYISVSDEAGHSKVYRVSEIKSLPADAPTDTIFATSGLEQLVLITCDGDWIPKQKTFDTRLVVIAKPAY